jgi:hypothetical protein
VENFEGQNYSATLSCFVNGKAIATRKVVVAPQARQTLQFTGELPADGPVEVVVGTDEVKSPTAKLERTAGKP